MRLQCGHDNCQTGGGGVLTQPKLHNEKTVEALLVVARHLENAGKSPDQFNLGHLLYLADRTHLGFFGRQITNDSYIAFKYGPGPSRVIDGLRTLAEPDRAHRPSESFMERLRGALRFAGMSDSPAPYPQFASLREPDQTWLSKTESRCLVSVLDEFGDLGFGELSRATHDDAFKQVRAERPDRVIPLEVLARSLEDGDKLVSYLADPFRD